MRDHLRRVAVLVIVFVVGAAAAAWSADEPAMQATPQAVTEVNVDPLLLQGVTENAKGTVYFYDERVPEVWATIGLRNGLRPGAVVAFVRRGEVVAEGLVTASKSADCIIRPAPGVPAGTILLGDDVRVIVNGSRRQLDAAIARERRQRVLGTLAIYAILGGSIAAERN